MSRSMLRRFGALLLGATLALTGLATPAQAADTGSITGQLTDGGVPVTGGYVDLYGDDVYHYDHASLDDQGRYAFDAVPPGRYRLSFVAWGHPMQFAYGKTDWQSANIINVTAGSATVVNEELLPLGTITGRLVDRTGAPVPSVSVSAEAVDNSSFAYGSTGPDGHFFIQAWPGSYRVRFDVGAFGQFAYGTLDRDAAAVFAVTAGDTVTVNDTLLPTGTVAGRFTDTSGAPLSGVDVYVSNGQLYGYTYTDEDGRYRLDQVPVGTGYTVQFSSSWLLVQQYAYGTVDESAAARFAVTEGRTTTVDDRQLPTGSVRLTAVDSRTGQPILNFASRISVDARDAVNGEVIYPAVPIGTHKIWAHASGYSFDGASVTVATGEQAEVRLVMEPMSRITATVVDAATGAPLPHVCIVPVRVDEVRMSDGCNALSDVDGKVTQMLPKGAGTYQLLAWPAEADGYGAQWLGPRGGTGDLRKATQFDVEAGGTITPPVIRMDRAGVITGQVVGPDGAVLSGGAARIAGEPVGENRGLGAFGIRDDGRYRIDKLGPYEWPLLFEVPGQATQWSGGEANRDRAERIKVVAGGTTTYNYQLDAGVTVTVASKTPFHGSVVARNADTGDIVGTWSISEPNVGVAIQLIGPQHIRFEYYSSEGGGRRFVGGEDFASAPKYKIHKHKGGAFELTLG